jgi:hypothetical protein
MTLFYYKMNLTKNNDESWPIVIIFKKNKK